MRTTGGLAVVDRTGARAARLPTAAGHRGARRRQTTVDDRALVRTGIVAATSRSQAPMLGRCPSPRTRAPRCTAIGPGPRALRARACERSAAPPWARGRSCAGALGPPVDQRVGRRLERVEAVVDGVLLQEAQLTQDVDAGLDLQGLGLLDLDLGERGGLAGLGLGLGGLGGGDRGLLLDQLVLDRLRRLRLLQGDREVEEELRSRRRSAGRPGRAAARAPTAPRPPS